MTIQQISERMAIGRFYRNGNRAKFAITNLDETTVVYEEYNPNGPTGKELRMSRKTFAALVKNHHLAETTYLRDEVTGLWREAVDPILEVKYEFNRNMKR
jgi:hypothetical protein